LAGKITTADGNTLDGVPTHPGGHRGGRTAGVPQPALPSAWWEGLPGPFSVRCPAQWRDICVKRPYAALGRTCDDYALAYSSGVKALERHRGRECGDVETVLADEWRKQPGLSWLAWATPGTPRAMPGTA